jgi:hypothetical protein
MDSLFHPDHEAPWERLCQQCNALAAVADNWWSRIVVDPETVLRVDVDSIEVRLRGNVLLTVEPRGQSLHCRIDPAWLLRFHPGGRAVLGEDGLAPEPAWVNSLEELGRSYAQVRRRACQHADRRQSVLDRLFLRHGAILAIDAPLGPGRIDLVALGPDGACVFFFLRRYQDADLRLAGPGGVGHKLLAWDAWLRESGPALDHVASLLDRSRLLHGPRQNRFARLPAPRRVHQRARLLIVDFDHAQRLHGLAKLRGDLEAGLDRTASGDDILAIGDPGNITHSTFFSAI